MNLMQDGLMNVVLLVPVFLFSLCVHEFAHAWVAVRKGDPTPELAGRLTLHPLAHADFLGTLLLPIFCIYYSLPFFGWAKPVPIDSRNFKNERRDMALVAAAGPISNVCLALLATAMLAILIRLPYEIKILDTMRIFAAVSIQVNLMLAAFNLIPIPPLDGFRVVQGFMSYDSARRFEAVAPYANIILLVLLFSGGLRILSYPVFRFYYLLLSTAGIPIT